MERNNILVLGAAGGIGRKVVEEALAVGLPVTAVLRTPSKLGLSHPLLTVVKGDVLQPETFEQYLTAGTIVMHTVGVPGGFFGDKPTVLYSEGAKRSIEAMRRRGAKRVFFISASAIEISPVMPAFVRWVEKHIVQKLLRYMYSDLRAMESRVRASELDWTIIRPPRLTNKEMTGKYRFAVNSWLQNCLSISRADVAHFMLYHSDDRGTYKGVIEIGY
jgi:putative NADH-flavin reductase